MGCCAASESNVGLGPGAPGAAFQKPRDEEFLYEIIFPSRPLQVTLTSSINNIDGYITAVDKLCPVENAEKAIVLNSKIIQVNGKQVEGYDVQIIANFLMQDPLPVTLMLCKPDGLESHEVPDMEPTTILELPDIVQK